MDATLEHANTTPTFADSPLRRDALNAFREHLVREFHMPATMALAQVNRELAANPLTSDVRLQDRERLAWK